METMFPNRRVVKIVSYLKIEYHKDINISVARKNTYEVVLNEKHG
jgi:hypothetical protein